MSSQFSARISRRVLIVTTLAMLPGAAFAQAETWKHYANDRFGTSIDYPSRFKPGEPPDNKDGLSFRAPDGARLLVWGSFNALEHGVAELEEFLRESANEKSDKITYRASGKNWLVLSGTRGDAIFYTRHLFSHKNEVENAFEISYPAALAGEYNPIVARIAKSLKGGRGYQTKGAP
jgi:serine/threonine-protein kinase